MKKLLFLFALTCTAITLNAQVSKADFDLINGQFNVSTVEKIIINNVRVYYTDGTNNWSYYEYKISSSSVEANDRGIIVKWYTDETKSKLKSVLTIPYSRMTLMSGNATVFSVDLAG